MSQRNKIVLTFFLTVGLFLGGFAFYYYSLQSEARSREKLIRTEERVIVVQAAQHTPMRSTPPRGVSHFDTRHEFSYSKDSVIAVMQPMQGNSLTPLTIRNGNARNNGNYAGHDSKGYIPRGNGSGAGGGVFYASSKRSGAGGSGANYSGSGLSSTNNVLTPSMVPLDSENNNIIMNMDPGLNPDHFIPVGDAPVFVLFLFFTYTFIRFVFIRKE